MPRCVMGSQCSQQQLQNGVAEKILQECAFSLKPVFSLSRVPVFLNELSSMLRFPGDFRLTEDSAFRRFLMGSKKHP